MKMAVLEQPHDGLRIFRIALMSATAIAAFMAIAALTLVGLSQAEDNMDKLVNRHAIKTGTELPSGPPGSSSIENGL